MKVRPVAAEVFRTDG